MMRHLPLALIATWMVGAARADQAIDFNRDIQPILSENCYFCHGPDANHRKADLRLDVREAAIDYGAIVPEDVDSSELIARLDEEDPDLIMPPPQSHKKLSKRQKRLLREWVAQGAPYERHWSFQPIVRPNLPKVDTGNSASPVVDAFIIDRLNQESFELSPPASPVRLVRRLHLDLVGLPPTPTEVDRFVSAYHVDQAGAIQDKVSQLLRSVHYAERMASHWLDVVRYADTVGFHGDQTQNVFPYRDWVIAAFANNMPFDEFTRKQIAGDLLPDRTSDDLVATCFNRLNMMTREGGAQPGEYLAKYAADRVRTVGMAWMGLTTGCAECHDHKFDPFTTKDFYSLGAFFADLKQWGVYSNYGYTPNQDLLGYNNNFPFPPEIEVVSNALLREQAEYRRELAQLAQQDLSEPERAVTAGQWWDLARDWLRANPTGWQTIQPDMTDQLAGGKQQKDTRAFDLVVTDSVITAVQVGLSQPWPSKSENVEVRFFRRSVDAEGKRQDKSLAVRDALANRYVGTFANTELIQNVAGRWTLPALDENGHSIKSTAFQYVIDETAATTQPSIAVFQFKSPVELSNGETLHVEIKGATQAKLDLSVSPLGRLRPLDPTEVESITLADALMDAPVALAWQATHRDASTDPSLVTRLTNAYRDCRDGKTFTMVSQSSEPMTMRVLPRGNWQDTSGEEVTPAVPEFLNDQVKTPSDRRLTRLDLANWLVDPANPLTARVVVNRLWKQFFGKGITEAADDFGAQGDPPSHPQLHDYLASELIESGWDIQHVVRLIVSSNTYQQDSQIRDELSEVDPENRLLSYHPPRRLEAEVVRDNALAIAGLINLDVGGPPIKPYQPEGYYSNLQFPNRSYSATLDDDQYRRGIYMHWQRTFLHPMLANFDAPSREDCVAIRSVANTPQQALTLLNDPAFVEAAGQFAYLALTDNETQSLDDTDRLRWMVRRALQREATTEEAARLLAFLDQQRAHFAEHPELVEQLGAVGLASSLRDWDSIQQQGGQPEWAAWAATARILLNLHETITRY